MEQPKAPEREAPAAVQLAFVPTPRPRPAPPAPDPVPVAAPTVQVAALVSDETTGQIAAPKEPVAVAPTLAPASEIEENATFVRVAAATVNRNTNAFSASLADQANIQPQRAGRVTLASVDPSVTAGDLLLAPASVNQDDAGLTVAPGGARTGALPVEDLQETGPQLSFVPRPTSRPNLNNSAGLALAAVTAPDRGEPAVGIPVPTPSPFQ